MQSLTTREVSAFTGLDEKSIRKDVEQGIVEVQSPPRFATASLVYFYARSLFAFQLAPADRKNLHRMISEALAEGRSHLELGTGWTLDVGALEQQVRDRLDAFGTWKDTLVVDPEILGGEPVFPGSRLSVRHVGSMVLRGGDRSEILEDYPCLTEVDLDYASLYTLAYPKVGRPR